MNGIFLVIIEQDDNAVSFRQCKHFFIEQVVGNVINLKRLLNGKQNVWKYQNGEERAIRTDGRKMFDDVRFECVQDMRKRGNAFEQYIHQIMVDQSGGSSSIDLVLVFSFFGIFGYILPHMQVAKL